MSDLVATPKTTSTDTPKQTLGRRLAPGFPFVAADTPEGDNMPVDDDVQRSLADLQKQITDSSGATEHRLKKMEESMLASMQDMMARMGFGPVGGERGPPPPPPPPPEGSGGRRRINVASMEKMEGDISLRNFQSWRNRWNDLCRLEQIASHPVAEQTAALRMCLSPSMQQIVEVVLEIPATGRHSPDYVLDEIFKHIRGRRNVALDRVEFETCRQEPGESFDDFFIRLKQIADCSELCVNCIDQRMTTRIMSAISDQGVRQKLLAKSPFPDMKIAVDLCRSEEAAARNGLQLSGQKVHQVKGKSGKNHHQNKKKPTHCTRCGHDPHKGKDD